MTVENKNSYYNMNSEILLEVKDLSIKYQTDSYANHAVNNISFTLNRGENLGFVGETGAGKTTTALSLLRLLPKGIGKISSGEIKFNGIDILKLSEAEMLPIRGSLISMIFQDPMTSLNPVITVGQQIAEVFKLHNSEKLSVEQINAKVDDLLNLVNIPPKRKNEYPHQFSGGMKQRVVIAIAVACSPMLLIADEPTTALDVTIQAQVLDMMENLKKKLNTATIMITHDLGIVAQTCDRVAIMYSGEIVETGRVEDIFQNNVHHPYTKGLFGSIPDLGKITKRLSPIKGQMTDPANLPVGCKFHPRCDFCSEECKTINPDPIEISSGHFIKCHNLGLRG